MKSFVIAFIAGIIGGIAYSFLPDASWGASVTGILVTLAVYFVINRKINSKLMLIVNASQDHIQATQEKVRKKMNAMQNKPGLNQTAAQKTLEGMQKEGIEEAIKMLDPANELFGWSLLARKQVSTIKYQLFFSLKQFDKADKLEGDLLLFDPQLVAMRMAREWMRSPFKKDSSPKEIQSSPITKLFKKGTSRAKGTTGAFLYNTYAWMLNKSDKSKMALELLTKGLDKCADDVIKSNLDVLRNNKASKFSNKAYSERWYSLHLEVPPQAKPQKQKMRRGRNQGFQPF
ncbi:hypothetical protein PQO03_02385 [Lentisphaera profundi]|uniref:Uncharacterized protein n=1 Tax=Lentisphaera profundi TaxID=1658616 RepID=A0ABY7VXL7_9BACT|nr:hypothetical protein [Lentisphaera profundi]WDE96808.1 hypothetical protein PQO03_02385 [Lentisphaera profundi]